MHRNVISSAVLALAALAACPFPSLAAPASAPRLATTQLPRSVSPTHYALSITPDAAAARFAAHVTIALNVLEPTSSITLNAVGLRFSSASLTPAGGDGAASAASVSVNPAEQTATFSFPRPLATGSYQLALDYSGAIGTQSVGLFAVDYDTVAGKKRALYTQFENSEARRVIPSWDEPAYKATFTLEAIIPPGQMAVSNMPALTTTTLADGRNLVRFAQTPKMSSYLLFFGLGEFERAAAAADGTEVGVITKQGSVAQAAFVLDSSKTILREYNDYFGVRYPLPKLDNIAAPGRSQVFGAMENWGAILSYEFTLLLDPAISTQADRQNVFSIAAHEMSHQWFGNLVTMQWWDDLWLNEGFASWMEGRTTARLHPEWNTALDAVNQREHAILRDSLATTHPVVQRIDTVEQARQAVDAITYQKGASVIRMLEAYVGADAWRKGVRAYMAAHAYGNTVSDDLWRQIDKAGGKPVTAIAHDFTLQPGVPMIRVDSASCKDGSTTIGLIQAEFSRDQPHRKPLRWRVPVIVQIAGSGRQVRAVVAGGEASVRVPGCGAVIANAGQTGYYRTLYAPTEFAALVRDFARLGPIDQIGLLSDSWSLGLAGLQPASDFLVLAKSVPLAADPQVWGKVADVFDQIHGQYAGAAERQQGFAGYAIARLAPVMAQTGWNARAGESTSAANLRAQLIETLSDLGDPQTIAEARRRYGARSADPAALPAALRKTVMAVVAQHADAATWDGMHAAALAEKQPLIKEQLYRLLAAAADPALARRALELAMSDEPGVSNRAAMLLMAAQAHPDETFDFALAHMQQVSQGVDAAAGSRFFPRLGAGSADPAMIGKLRAYAGANLAQSSRRDAETAIAVIQDRIKVRAERLPAIDAWLATDTR